MATVRKVNKYVHYFESQKPSAVASQKGCLGTAYCLGDEVVTSKWRSADILVWNNINHSQLPTQEQRTKPLGTCLSPWTLMCLGKRHTPGAHVKYQIPRAGSPTISMPEELHSHQILDAWLRLLLHRSLFWNLITKFNLIVLKCPPLLDYQLLTIMSNMRVRLGDHLYICNVVNPPWTCPCWDAVFAQQPYTCGFVSISRKVIVSAQGS